MSIVIRDLNFKTDKAKSYTYQDLDVYQLEGTRNELALSDFDAIRNSINNIFFIKKGTRILDPEFGSDLDFFLFEQINRENAQLLGEAVEEMLTQEPRILVDVIDVQIDSVNNQYIVDVFFAVPTLTNDILNASYVLSRDSGVVINSTKVHN